jgi:hypothetical protein
MSAAIVLRLPGLRDALRFSMHLLMEGMLLKPRMDLGGAPDRSWPHAWQRLSRVQPAHEAKHEPSWSATSRPSLKEACDIQ